MITEESITAVKEAIIIDQLLADFLTLKKSGSGFTACCPFHGEKTASLHVSPSKGMFKCFGCGEGGDGIKFLMKQERLTYPDAVRYAAKKFNITLVEVAANAEDVQIKETKTSLFEINASVCALYQKNLLRILQTEPNHWVTIELHQNRNLSDDTIIDFKLGFAPDGWDFLCNTFKDAEQSVLLKDLGLIATNAKGGNYDYFRNRIMFPFIDQLGRVTGFTGRKSDDGDEQNPKYFNSKDSMLFKKKSTFYGLYQSEKTIRKESHAILVEGQFDVCQMHQAGICNTIAASGTAFTEEHAVQLKRFCPHAIIMTDGDKAGLASALKTIDILVENNIKTEVVPLPSGLDPDAFIRNQQKILEEKGMALR